MPMLAASGIEPIIIIGVMIASAIYQAFAKRKQDKESWDDWNWNPTNQPPTPPLQKTPPVIPTKSMPRPIPPIPKRPPPVPKVIVAHDHEAHEGPDRELARLEQSQQAYTRAANLQRRVETHLAEIDRQTATARATAPRTRNRPQAAEQIVRAFRGPQTIRQAVLASFVLNPPKALE